MSNLIDFAVKHTERGACQCGQCFDAPPDPEKHQPTGHTADLMFFKVSPKGDPSAGVFYTLVQEEFPHWLDGKEHSYLQIGGDVGDQGIALMIMGLGSLLGVWKLLTPNSVMPFLDEATKMQMAGSGYITIKTT